MKIRLSFLFSLFLIQFSFAQDLHFSAFHFLNTNFNSATSNPKFIGYTAAAGYRNQYRTVPVNYNTASINVNKHGKYKLINYNLGLQFNSDKAGDVSYSRTEFFVPTALHFNLIKNHFISLGFSPGLKSFSVDPTKMSFDEQYQNGMYNSLNLNGENFSRVSVFIPSSLISFNYTLSSIGKFRNIQFGISRMLLFDKNKEWVKNSIPSFNRLNNFLLSMDYILNENNFLTLNSMYQKQKVQDNLINGISYHHVLNRSQGITKAIGLGLFYRHKDAIIIQPSFLFDNYEVAVSYDVNNSKFKNVTNSRGAFEICIRYKLNTFFEKLPLKKSCPVFI
jgi:type IX secretion system PorP/SprF family membrane protein